MTNGEDTFPQFNDFAKLAHHILSLEMRVPNSEVERIIKDMEGFGFRFKNSWASVELLEHTVIDFWKKELIKS